MTLPEKIGYVRDYYGAAILLAVVLLVAGVFFLVDAGREKVETALHVIIVDSEIDRDKIPQLREELTELLALDTKKEEVVIETDLSGKQNQSSAATVGAYFISGRTDIVICNKERFSAYAVAGYLKPWEPDEFSVKEERLFYGVKRNYEGGAITEIENDPHDAEAEGARIYGCFLEGTEGWAVGVLQNAPNPENAVKTMEYFVNLNNLLN